MPTAPLSPPAKRPAPARRRSRAAAVTATVEAIESKNVEAVKPSSALGTAADTPPATRRGALGDRAARLREAARQPLRQGGAQLARTVRQQLKALVLGVFPPTQTGGIDYDRPLGDPGLFGPDSATWKIHGDFPGMMAGGICALMLQTLHPLALAGVWDHSSFRTDLIGRLRRTTAFVAGTSYAGTDEAERLIARVRKIHAAVRGTLPDGRPYEASDPALLTWVHLTEVSSFLAGYRAYCRADLPMALQDAYYAETARVAEALGARDVPKSAAAVADYFARIQPELAYTERSAATLAVLERIRLPIPDGGASRALFLGAAGALLPDWALARLPRGRLTRLGDRAAAVTLKAIGPTLRAALSEGVAARACDRVGASRSALQFA